MVLIGEIRDLETAEAAIQAVADRPPGLQHAAHQRRLLSANTRLLDMGVEPFLVTSSRGGRAWPSGWSARSAPTARRPTSPTATKLPADFNYQGGELWRGQGCRECRNTGYRGRLGIFELMVINDEIRELIMKRSGAGSIMHAGRKNGLGLLREDGWDKVRLGITTPAEVQRVTKM